MAELYLIKAKLYCEQEVMNFYYANECLSEDLTEMYDPSRI